MIYALTFIMGIGVGCCAALRTRSSAHRAQVLLPWNAFITASDYFGRVFSTVTTCAGRVLRPLRLDFNIVCRRFENYFSVAYLGSNCIGLRPRALADASARSAGAQGWPSSSARRSRS